MRLFTAITFPEEMKASLYNEVEKLHRIASDGSFTAKDNLHLTLNFIGETKRLEEVKQAMNQAVLKSKAETFRLMVKGFGLFKRREGDIYWIGVEQDRILVKLQKQLVKELKDSGFFDIDDREYRPHLTLGRRVKLGNPVNQKQFEESIQPSDMKVSRISLMKSERIQGKLIYTEIYYVILPDGDGENEDFS